MQQDPAAPLIEERTLIPLPLFHTQRARMTAQDVRLDRRPVRITFYTGGEYLRIGLTVWVADPIALDQLNAR
ncbi:hypothetical protein D3C80_862780 [compost metagenome]